MLDLQAMLVGGVGAFLLLFARIGATLSVLPGIGDSFVPTPVRLLFALALALMLTPLLAPSLPDLPESPGVLVRLVLFEIAIGLFIGGIARILISALDVAGTVIAFQIGLSNAFVFNPGLMGQTPITAAFMGLTGATLLFVTNLHHMMIGAMIGSYDAFPPGALPATGDLAATVTQLVAEAFALGVTLAAPLIAVGLILYLGVGLLNRLMPQIQVFFVALPLQIGLGMLVFALLGSAMFLYWLNRFADGFTALLGTP